LNTVITIAWILLAARLAAQLWLDILNRRAARAAASAPPPELAGILDAETYQRSVAYTLAKNRFSSFETVWDAVWLALFLFSGILPWLWELGTGWMGMSLWGQGLALFLIGVLLQAPGLPLEWWAQFRLEAAFGFNRSSLGLWWLDRAKGLALAFVLGYPLLVALLWLVGMSRWWWLWGFALLLAFQLVMVVLYPTLIMPLFNKFSELPEGALRERLLGLGRRTGFHARSILVMDGSRRSAHSNAFFSGFGRWRRIVLFDTLIEQLGEHGLEAVLAHEIGHYKLGHIPRMLLVGAAALLVNFALIGWLAAAPWFVTAFGFVHDPAVLAPTLLLFGLGAGLVSFWLTPLTNMVSRRHEYQADAYARAHLDNDPMPLVGALRTLSEKNLSNLTPHPLYSAFYYSHPTLLERERHLVSCA
jgi:STE24 endopeptidase